MTDATRAKRIGITIFALSIIGLGVSMPFMAKKLEGRGDQLVWFEEMVTGESFTFAGEPVGVRTLDDPARVEISWRGATIEQPLVGQRVKERLPDLLKHEDWMKVLPMAEGAQTRAELDAMVARGAVSPRLLVAMRLPPEGFDPESWGQVRRKDWRYRFIELVTEGDGTEPFREFGGTYGELDALSDRDTRAELGRESDAWMYHAMLQVTPATLYRSRSKPIEGAMRAMGWTWPIAGLSCIGIVVGLGMMAASRVEPPDAPFDESAGA